MLKVFIIVYLTGQFAGSVGPLPFDVDQCRQVSAELLSPEAARMYHVAFLCVERAERPTK